VSRTTARSDALTQGRAMLRANGMAKGAKASSARSSNTNYLRRHVERVAEEVGGKVVTPRLDFSSLDNRTRRD